MDLKLNFDYIVENPDHTKKLAAALDTTNVTLKKQVFELLGALCVYNVDGYSRALEVLEHYKRNKDERYRFKLVVEELRNGKDLELLSTVAAFLNCSIIAAKSPRDRIRVRNEYLGLKVLDAISRLRTTFSDSESDLFVQLDIFEEQRLADECQLTGPNGVDLSSHQDVFYAILRQVAGTPPEFPFLNILQHLLRIDASLPISDIIWDTAEKLVHRTTLCETKEDADKLLRLPSYHHSLNKLLRGLQETGGRCQCSCHGTNEGRSRKRTPLQLSFSASDGARTPGILSPANSSLAFNPELLASLSRAISPPPKGTPSAVPTNPPTEGPKPPPPPPPPPPLPTTSAPPPGLPPPPPPPPSGLSPSVKTTAAATSQKETRLPQQFTPKPKNKMKTLNWAKIPTTKVVGKNNLWSLIAKVHDGSPNNLDFETIEGLFCQPNLMNGQASPRLAAKNGRDSLDRKKRETSEINLLDGKRSLNVNIFLKQFRSSNDEIIAILKRGAHAEIGAEKMRGLMKILPESDEIELLRGYTGERNRLGNAEKFLLELIELPNYKLRCEGMLLKEEFSSNMTYLEPAIETIESAVEELKHCQELHEVLYMLLVMGNFLNSGSYAGDAAGFKMMSLLKVTEIRANKPGINLINYVAQEAESKFPNLLRFPDLLPSLEEASRLSIDNLKTEIVNLSNKVAKVSQQVLATSEDIKQQMEEFLKFAARETAEVQKELDNLEKVRVDMAEFLCEDLQSFKLEESFKVFHSFCQKFKTAIEENEKRRQNEKRAAQRRKHREEQAIKKNTGDNRPSSFSGSESDNILDTLLGGFKCRSAKAKREAELSRMNSLTSEEDPISSPRVIRRRMGSANSDGADTQSPDVTPNGTLRRRRSRLSSEDREANLLDYLRSTAEADGGREKTESGSLDRSWFKRSSRRRRPEMLSVELNDRERSASPGPSPLLERKAAALEPSETSRPKQWRLKIEEWLQENEKEQEREKKLRDKIALERLRRQEMEQRENDTLAPVDDDWKTGKGLATLHEVKTDSEIYANKNRQIDSTPETAECMPLKDKSKWRKSNLNVANSSESIDDERRRSRSRRNTSDPEMDTISFYIRSDTQSAENLNPADNILNISCDQSDRQMTAPTVLYPSALPKDDKMVPPSSNTNESDPGILIGRSRFYQSMKEPAPKNIEQIANQNIVEGNGELKQIPKNNNELKSTVDDETHLNNDDVNFDRFSHMRKTTRRGKSRNKTSENEIRKSQDHLDSDMKAEKADSHFQEHLDNDLDMDSKFVEDALKEINRSSKEIQNLSDEKVKSPGNLFNKYVGENSQTTGNGDEQKKKDTSLKARLSKRLLSLTENLKVGAKPIEAVESNTFQSASEDKKHNLITDSPCPSIDKILSERKASLTEEKTNPILEHREKILSRPRQDMMQIPVRNQVPTSCSPIIIAKPHFLKDSYMADTNSVKIVHATPVTHDVKELVQKGREECEKDEGFEETQSQLSEAASQGAGSSYDTDLADSPRSIRQIKDANAAQNISATDKMQADIPLLKNEKTMQQNKTDIPAGTTKCETTTVGKTPGRYTAPKSSLVRPQTSKTGKNPRPTLSVTRSSPGTRPQTPANPKSSLSRMSGSESKIVKKPSLRGLGDLTETSPKIGRRVAAYTKAIKSMTNNLRGSKNFENYDVTQSMPPTPSEEKKTFASSLNLVEKGKKARSSSSVYSRSSVNGLSSRRGSEKSLSSRRSSDRSLNLSRKSSEASVVTVKSASRRSPVPTIRRPKPVSNRLTIPTKTKAKPTRPKSPVQTKQLRVPSTVKPVARSNSVPKPTVVPNRTSGEKASFTFMKATSASSAKTAPTKCTPEQNKFKSSNNLRTTSKPIPLAKVDPSPNRTKQRC